MLGSFGVCWIVHTVLIEMLSHVLIGWAFIGCIHVVLWHITYPLGSYGVCFLVHTVLIKMVSHVIFLGFIMFMLDVILGPTP